MGTPTALTAAWTPNTDPCTTWPGVYCSVTGQVTRLDFAAVPGGPVTGSLPGTSLTALSSLAAISMGTNAVLSGTLPAAWSTLTALTSITLPDPGAVSGTLPPQWSTLTNLVALGLEGTSLSGTMPPQYSTLTRMTSLDLSATSLSGSIPPQFSTLTSLAVLDLSASSLSGAVPQALSALTALSVLDLSSTALSGAFPTQLATLTSLVSLQLDGTQLAGSLPPSFSALTSLTLLSVGGSTGLTGSLPAQWSALTRLLSLSVTDAANLFGILPPAFSSMSQLTSLTVASTSVQGTIPSQYGSLTSLHALDVSNNLLVGSVPASMGGLTALRSINLGTNSNLCGALPAGLTQTSAITSGTAVGTGCAPPPRPPPLTPPEPPAPPPSPKPPAPPPAPTGVTEFKARVNKVINDVSELPAANNGFVYEIDGRYLNANFSITASSPVPVCNKEVAQEQRASISENLEIPPQNVTLGCSGLTASRRRLSTSVEAAASNPSHGRSLQQVSTTGDPLCDPTAEYQVLFDLDPSVDLAAFSQKLRDYIGMLRGQRCRAFNYGDNITAGTVVRATALNRDVDCSAWRTDAATVLSMSITNVTCEVTRLPFDPNALRPPPVFITPTPDGGGSSFPLAAIIGAAAGGGVCCCFPFAFFLLYRRRKKRKEQEEAQAAGKLTDLDEAQAPGKGAGEGSGNGSQRGSHHTSDVGAAAVDAGAGANRARRVSAGGGGSIQGGRHLAPSRLSQEARAVDGRPRTPEALATAGARPGTADQEGRGAVVRQGTQDSEPRDSGRGSLMGKVSWLPLRSGVEEPAGSQKVLSRAVSGNLMADLDGVRVGGLSRNPSMTMASKALPSVGDGALEATRTSRGTGGGGPSLPPRMSGTNPTVSKNFVQLNLNVSKKTKVVKTAGEKPSRSQVTIHEFVSRVVDTHKGVQSLQPDAVKQLWQQRALSRDLSHKGSTTLDEEDGVQRVSSTIGVPGHGRLTGAMLLQQEDGVLRASSTASGLRPPTLHQLEAVGAFTDLHEANARRTLKSALKKPGGGFLTERHGLGGSGSVVGSPSARFSPGTTQDSIDHEHMLSARASKATISSLGGVASMSGAFGDGPLSAVPTRVVGMGGPRGVSFSGTVMAKEFEVVHPLEEEEQSDVGSEASTSGPLKFVGANAGSRRPSMTGAAPVVPEEAGPGFGQINQGGLESQRTSRLAVAADAAGGPSGPRVLSRGASASGIKFAEPDRESTRASAAGRRPLPRRGVSFSGATQQALKDKLKARLAGEGVSDPVVQAAEQHARNATRKQSFSGMDSAVPGAWGADRALAHKSIDDEFAEGRAAQAAAAARRAAASQASAAKAEEGLLATGIGSFFRSLFGGRKSAAGSAAGDSQRGGGPQQAGGEASASRARQGSSMPSAESHTVGSRAPSASSQHPAPHSKSFLGRMFGSNGDRGAAAAAGARGADARAGASLLLQGEGEYELDDGAATGASKGGMSEDGFVLGKSLSKAVISRANSRLSLGRPDGDSIYSQDMDDDGRIGDLQDSNLAMQSRSTNPLSVRPAIQQVMDLMSSQEMNEITGTEEPMLDRRTAPSLSNEQRQIQVAIPDVAKRRGSADSVATRTPSQANLASLAGDSRWDELMSQVEPGSVEVGTQDAGRTPAPGRPLSMSGQQDAPARARPLSAAAGPGGGAGPRSPAATRAPASIPLAGTTQAGLSVGGAGTGAGGGPSAVAAAEARPGSAMRKALHGARPQTPEDDVLVLEEATGPVRRNYAPVPVPPGSVAMGPGGVPIGTSPRARRASMEMREQAIIEHLKQEADEFEQLLCGLAAPTLAAAPLPPHARTAPVPASGAGAAGRSRGGAPPQPTGSSTTVGLPRKANTRPRQRLGDEVLRLDLDQEGEEGGSPSRLSPTRTAAGSGLLSPTAPRLGAGATLASALGSSGARRATAPASAHPHSSVEAGGESPMNQNEVRQAAASMARRTIDVVELGLNSSSGGGGSRRKGEPLLFTNALFDEGADAGTNTAVKLGLMAAGGAFPAGPPARGAAPSQGSPTSAAGKSGTFSRLAPGSQASGGWLQDSPGESSQTVARSNAAPSSSDGSRGSGDGAAYPPAPPPPRMLSSAGNPGGQGLGLGMGSRTLPARKPSFKQQSSLERSNIPELPSRFVSSFQQASSAVAQNAAAARPSTSSTPSAAARGQGKPQLFQRAAAPAPSSSSPRNQQEGSRGGTWASQAPHPSDGTDLIPDISDAVFRDRTSAQQGSGRPGAARPLSAMRRAQADLNSGAAASRGDELDELEDEDEARVLAPAPRQAQGRGGGVRGGAAADRTRSAW